MSLLESLVAEDKTMTNFWQIQIEVFHIPFVLQYQTISFSKSVVVAFHSQKKAWNSSLPAFFLLMSLSTRLPSITLRQSCYTKFHFQSCSPQAKKLIKFIFQKLSTTCPALIIAAINHFASHSVEQWSWLLFCDCLIYSPPSLLLPTSRSFALPKSDFLRFK